MKKHSVVLVLVLSCQSNYPNAAPASNRWSWMPQFLQTLLHSVTQNDHKVAVRYDATDALCAQESAAATKRLAHVQNALNSLGIQTDQNNCPRIAFCFSGGGFRAMVISLFALLAAREEGLLDSVLYAAGLSGSTWALAPWISSGLDLPAYINGLGARTENGLNPSQAADDLWRISDYLVNKVKAGQGFSSIDIYSTFLANVLLQEFGDNRFFVTLADTHKAVDTGAYPLPIYTTVTPDVYPYAWFEVTPYEMGSSYAKTYIPTSAYGRTFQNGISAENAPELSLAYMMGVFGSAYDADMRDLINSYTSVIFSDVDELPDFMQPAITAMLHDIKINHPLNTVRIAPSNEKNFSYKFQESPLKDKANLTLMDGGLACNLPFPALLRPARAVDIIIVYDATADNQNFDTLRQTQEYAARNNLPFPSIDYTDLGTSIVRVFKDEANSACPVVIYFPMIKNGDYSTDFDPLACESEYCDTFNFKYSQEQINTLGGLAYFGIKQNADLIKQTIQEVVAQKSN